jgi:molecular chaperone DnaK
MAADNKMLGQFDLVGIPPAPRGMPQIEVTFDIDANGIVNVSAKDKATGKEQAIRIQASGGLNDKDIERMVREAEEHADEDKKKRELVDARNHADSLIHTTEKHLKEHGDKVAAADKDAIENDIKALREAMTGEDVAAIQQRTQALMQSSMKLGEAAYKAQQEPGAAGPGGTAGGPTGGDAGGTGGGKSSGGDGVVDADFEEVDDENKKSA